VHTNEPSQFGAFAPTPAQKLLIGLANATWLGRGGARWVMSSLIERIRPGPVDVERFGLKLRLHHYGTQYSEKKMLLKIAHYDREEIAHLLRNAGDAFHFADIGAHTGVYSYAVKSKCPAARIAAFEPNPSYYRRLAFNVRSNALADFHVVQAAVGARRGIGSFHFERDSMVGGGPAFEVEVVPLYDALLEKGFKRLDGMKIDIEGYEDRALFPYFEAAPAEFRPRTLVIEHGQKHHWERDCLALCASLGYQAVWRSELNTVFERST
jgi:FkbM family methyltransferase